jgi:hypothetical protein
MAQETGFLSEEPDEVRKDLEEEASFLTKKQSSPVDLYILAEVEDRGDVLLTTSRIGKVACEVRVSLLEGVDPKLTELREKRYARYTGELGGRA